MEKIVLKEVISGGQVGADQGGLLAAKENCFLIGGWAPKGYRTRNGNRPDILRDIFFLQERETSSYRHRTFANVQDSDGTILFCNDFGTAGIKCTKEAIGFYKKPSYDVITDMKTDDPQLDQRIFESIFEWIKIHQIKVLNVAGNSQPQPAMFTRSYRFFNGLFIFINEKQGGTNERDSNGYSKKDAGRSGWRNSRRQKIRRERKQIRRDKDYENYAKHS